MNPPVSIVILNFNGKENLKYCLPSIERQNYKPLEVIVVDNGSKDGSVDFLKARYPRVKLIENKKNLGYSIGNNIGVSKAKGKYILILNDDTKLTPDLVTKLVKKMENDQRIGVAMPKILLMDKPNMVDSAGSFFTKLGIFRHMSRFENGTVELPEKIFSAKSACILIRKELYTELGGFDEDFFAYAVDPDLCWRVWQRGFEVVLVPGAVMYHKGAATNIKYVNAHFIVYETFKNVISSLIKNLEVHYIYILGINIGISFFGILLYIFRLKPKQAFAIISAVSWNAINLKHNLGKRKLTQSKRRVSDKQIFEELMVPVSIPYFFKNALAYTKYW